MLSVKVGQQRDGGKVGSQKSTPYLVRSSTNTAISQRHCQAGASSGRRCHSRPNRPSRDSRVRTGQVFPAGTEQTSADDARYTLPSGEQQRRGLALSPDSWRDSPGDAASPQTPSRRSHGGHWGSSYRRPFPLTEKSSAAFPCGCSSTSTSTWNKSTPLQTFMSRCNSQAKVDRNAAQD
jgi:hypothetical protein